MSIKTILNVNSSGRYEDSISRKVTTSLVSLLKAKNLGHETVERNVAEGLPFVDEKWIEANFTAADERSDSHNQTLEYSDHLVSELMISDTIVIGSPIYNFNIPATLKAWFDMVARVGLTFRYTENGPEGLLRDKKVYIVISSGGVPIGSPMDLASPYLKVVLNFLGLSNVTLIDASKLDQTIDLKNQLQTLIAA